MRNRTMRPAQLNEHKRICAKTRVVDSSNFMSKKIYLYWIRDLSMSNEDLRTIRKSMSLKVQ